MLNVYILYCLVRSILSCCSQNGQANKYMNTNYKHEHIDAPTYEPMNTHTQIYQARTQGGVGGVVRHPLETAGIDFYSGFRKNGHGGCKWKS